MPIGIDFGARHVRAAQLARCGDRWQVIAAGVRALPLDLPADGEDRARAQVAALRDVLDSSPFKGRGVVSCLPGSIIQYKNLRLPPMPPTDLRTAVEWEASDRLKFGQNYQIQFYDAGEVRQGEERRQEVILLAVPVDAVERHVAVLTECGLTPVAIDAAPSALGRWAAYESNAAQGVQLVLDVGATGASVLISRAGRVLFFRRVDPGGRQLEDAIAKLMNTTPLEAERILRMRGGGGGGAEDGALVGSMRREGANLALSDAVRPVLTDITREVGLCLRYQCVTFRGDRPQSCVLAGGGAGDPLLPILLLQEAGVTVTDPMQPSRFDWSRVNESLLSQYPAPSWAVALGMALRNERSEMKGAA